MDKVWLRQYPAAEAFNTENHPPSVPALLEPAFLRWHDSPACVFMGRSTSFGQIDALARALTAWLLQSSGLARGDRVALMLPGVPQFAVVVLAVWRAGMVVVNLDPRSAVPELALQLKDSGARLVVAIDSAAPLLQQALRAVRAPPAGPSRQVLLTSLGELLGPLQRRWVNHLARRAQGPRSAHDVSGPGAWGDAVALLRWPQVLLRGSQLASAAPSGAPAPGPDDIALLQYTGGTTGVSKAAVLLHRQLVANLLQCEAWYGPALALRPAAEQLVVAGTLPLFHAFGFSACLLLPLHLGACTLLQPDPGDIAGWVKILSRQRCHVMAGTNSLYDALARHRDIDRIDWSALRLSLAGGMPVQPATALLWQHQTGGVLCQGYGLAEASPCVSCNPVDSQRFSGSIGLPLPGTEVRLFDEAGHDVPPGTPGELVVRGPQVTAGYWQHPEETARVMTADGFLRTGDIGMVDAQGHFSLVDRKKDMILVSGFNVYPNEVEDVVMQVAGVLECAAVAWPDERTGEVVKLLVVRADADSLHPTEAELRAVCSTQLAGYKRPRLIEFRTALPRSALGKVLRRELR